MDDTVLALHSLEFFTSSFVESSDYCTAVM